MTFADIQALDGALSPLLYGFGIALILLETVVLTRRKLPRDKASRWLSVWCGALAFGTEALVHTTLLLGVQMWVYEHRLSTSASSGGSGSGASW